LFFRSLPISYPPPSSGSERSFLCLAAFVTPFCLKINTPTHPPCKREPHLSFFFFPLLLSPSPTFFLFLAFVCPPLEQLVLFSSLPLVSGDNAVLCSLLSTARPVSVELGQGASLSSHIRRIVPLRLFLPKPPFFRPSLIFLFRDFFSMPLRFFKRCFFCFRLLVFFDKSSLFRSPARSLCPWFFVSYFQSPGFFRYNPVFLASPSFCFRGFLLFS